MCRSTKACMFCLSVALLALGATSMAQAGVLLSDNFNTGTVGDPPPGWTDFYYPPGSGSYTRSQAASLGVTLSLDSSVHLGPSGNSVHFRDTSLSVGSHLDHAFAAAPHVTVEYYMRAGSTTDEGAFVVLLGSGGSDYATAFRKDTGYIGVHGWSGGWVNPTLLSYTVGEWYFVRRTLDCATNTGTFFVQEVDNPAHFATYAIGSNYVTPSVDTIRMLTANTLGVDTGIDNLTITTVPVPEPATMTLMAAGLGGLALLRKRRRAA